MPDNDDLRFVFALISFNIIRQLFVDVFTRVSKAEVNNTVFLIARITLAVVTLAFLAGWVKVGKPLLGIRADKAGENKVIGFVIKRQLALCDKIVYLITLGTGVNLQIGKAKALQRFCQIRLGVKISCCSCFIRNQRVIANNHHLRQHTRQPVIIHGRIGVQPIEIIIERGAALNAVCNKFRFLRSA